MGNFVAKFLLYNKLSKLLGLFYSENVKGTALRININRFIGHNVGQIREVADNLALKVSNTTPSRIGNHFFPAAAHINLSDLTVQFISRRTDLTKL